MHKVLHLSLLPDAAWTMLGVGAGGSIVQAVEPDTNSLRIWGPGEPQPPNRLRGIVKVRDPG